MLPALLRQFEPPSRSRAGVFLSWLPSLWYRAVTDERQTVPGYWDIYLARDGARKAVPEMSQPAYAFYLLQEQVFVLRMKGVGFLQASY